MEWNLKKSLVEKISQFRTPPLEGTPLSQSTKLAKSVLPTEVVPDLPSTGEISNWERAFKALALMTCTGFVSSLQVERRVARIREVAGDEPADFLIRAFNSTRSNFMQDFMG